MSVKPKLTNPCTIYLVRHGETEWNVKRLLQGQQDSPLTEQGLQQAQELATRLKPIHFDAIFSSDSLRAQRTAEVVAIERQMAVTATEILRERSYGRYEGKHIEDFIGDMREQITKLEKITEHTERLQFKYMDEIESDHELFSRASQFLREIALGYADKTVLVVSHGGVLKSFLLAIGWGTYQELQHNAIQNTAYLKILCDGTDFFVEETWGVVKTVPGSKDEAKIK